MSYAAPVSAIYATADGNSSGAGTLVSPYGSAQTAVDRAPSGSTVVLRGGTYHETLNIPKGKALTIQPAPKEAVWFDGSSKVTGWVKSGSTWVVSNWNYIFDHRVSFAAGADESSTWVNPSYPMAGYPDQVWISGQKLTQVGSASAVTTGKFFVDEAGKRLIIGSDPTGKTVEASTLSKAIKVWGSGSVLRGFGVRRYAPNMAKFGAVSAEMPDVTFENMVVSDNATIGIYCWADNHKFRNLTVTGNGALGVGCNQANNLRLTDSRVSTNNTGMFNREPVSGGVKLTNSSGSVVKGNVIESNSTTGLWFDVSMTQTQVIGNTIRNNGGHGFEIEISDNSLVADNYIVGNAGTGIWSFDASYVNIWNNTLVNNKRSLSFWQDSRRLGRNINVHNNVVAFGTDFCPLLTQDLRKQWTGDDFILKMNGNVYHRPAPTSTSRFACWADGAANIKAYFTLPTFQSGTGQDLRSKVYEGGTVADGTSGLTTSAKSSSTGVALPLPASVASVIGRPTGEAVLGAYGSAKN